MTRIRLELTVYATGRRLHQLATIGLLRAEYVVAALSSPDPIEAHAAQQRYLCPQQTPCELDGGVIVTSVVDETTATLSARPDTTVVLVPPMSLVSRTSLEAMVGMSSADVRCVPPVRQPIPPGSITVREAVPIVTLLAISGAGGAGLALIERAAWSMAGALWRRTVTGEMIAEAARNRSGQWSVQVRAGDVAGTFRSSSDRAESLSFQVAEGVLIPDLGYTADLPRFLVDAVSWSVHHRGDAADFAGHYLEVQGRLADLEVKSIRPARH